MPEIVAVADETLTVSSPEPLASAKIPVLDSPSTSYVPMMTGPDAVDRRCSPRGQSTRPRRGPCVVSPRSSSFPTRWGLLEMLTRYTDAVDEAAAI